MRLAHSLSLICAAMVVAALALAAPTLDLTLGTDRTVYLVGEPVQLTLKVRNSGQAAVFGRLRLRPYLPPGQERSTLSYCLAGQCTEFLGSIPGIEVRDIDFGLDTLAPGKEIQSAIVVARDPRSSRLILATPGDYEFRVTMWGIHEHQDALRRGRGVELVASAFVTAVPAPATESAAFTEYERGGLGKLAQYDRSYVVLASAEIRAAGEFLERYPSSLYSETLRRPLVEALRPLVHSKRASPYEVQLLDSLRAWNKWDGIDRPYLLREPPQR